MTIVSPYTMIGAPITSKSLSSSLSLIGSSLACLKRNVVAAMLASCCFNLKNEYPETCINTAIACYRLPMEK